MINSFESYIKEFSNWEMKGWEFTIFKDRCIEQDPSWDFGENIAGAICTAKTVLDMGTGGGEFLAGLANLPKKVCATESYETNLPVARARLEPLGIAVHFITEDAHLPFAENQFDVVINRHESFDAGEVFRILKPSGQFFTQQVGGKDNRKLNELLGSCVENEYGDWQLSAATKALLSEGLEIEQSIEEFPETTFLDIGAVVGYLKAIPWQIGDFSVEKYRQPLIAMHTALLQNKQLTVNSHRFYIAARKPNI